MIGSRFYFRLRKYYGTLRYKKYRQLRSKIDPWFELLDEKLIF